MNQILKNIENYQKNLEKNIYIMELKHNKYKIKN